jgi:hypothetical protein
MSLVISSVFTYDTDAGNYIQAVETADGQALESATRKAINDFVIGCKQDGIWDAIKASCILSGARTLAGALVPLVGTAPTNYNFVAGDYDRKTGLVGDGSTKYLDSNRASDADPQNSHHLSTFATSTPSGVNVVEIGATNGTEVSMIGRVSSETNSVFLSRRLNSLAPRIAVNITAVTGFRGVARPNSASINARAGGNNFSLTEASLATGSNTTEIFRRGGGGFGPSNARLAFYSIGESLDLAKLDGRVTDLINKFSQVIP